VTEPAEAVPPPDGTTAPSDWLRRRREVLRYSLSLGVPVGAYGISFGAVAVAAGLSVPQACALSVLAFTGGSQFAFVGVVGGGGAPLAGMASALLLGARNSFYAVRMTSLLRVRGVRRLVGAWMTIDESTAVATAQRDEPGARLGFWLTGATIFVCWNLATLVGAVAGQRLGDPQTYGLDAVAPAAFLAFLWPRLTGRDGGRGRLVAAAAAAIALVTSLVLPAGLPVLLAAAPAVWAGVRATRDSSDRAEPGMPT
jgi:predicted branched-subunit amino acid permease